MGITGRVDDLGHAREVVNRLEDGKEGPLDLKEQLHLAESLVEALEEREDAVELAGSEIHFQIQKMEALGQKEEAYALLKETLKL